MIISTKKKPAVIAFVLMLTVAATIISVAPPVAAQLKTWAYVSVIPKTAGLGQYVLINAWISPPPPIDIRGNPIVYHNYTFVITKPDGSTETRIIANSEGPGTVYFTYTPSALGTYSVKFTWAGDATHEPSESPLVYFTVQQEPLPGYPGVNLPTGYWQRPISAEYREWTSISGGWLSGGWCQYNASDGCYNPYSTGPDTAHILWKKDVGIGGLIGGEMYDAKFISASAEPIIMLGRAYYSAAGSIWCVDLRTGKELWKIAGSGSLLGMPAYSTPAGVGGAPGWTTGGLWAISGASWNLYDPYTGAVKRSITGPGAAWGTLFGSIDINPQDGRAYIIGTLWNMSSGHSAVKWDATKAGPRFQDNLVWRQNFTASLSEGPHQCAVTNNVLVATGYSYKLGFNLTTGALMYNLTNPGGISEEVTSRSAGYGRIFMPGDDMRHRAYDVLSGSLLWTTEPAEYPWGAFWPYATGVAYGKIYHGSYDGYFYCYNADTGGTEWKYYSGNTTEGPYGHWPFYCKPSIADGKVYVGTTEHSPTQPYMRGYRFYCLDANTGDYKWSISFSASGSSIAEGTLLTANGYDGLLYAFDKGLTTTTVSVSQDVIANGSSTLIQGTVLDKSPAQLGTPAISDESMTAWMEYLHMQKPMSTNATGVTVFLQAVKSDGSIIDIWHVKSDILGHFEYLWTPPDTDTYKILATFEGSGSYWPSYAETALGVTAAPPPAEPVEIPAYPDYTPMFTGIIAAVAIAIIIGVVSLYSIRKMRK